MNILTAAASRRKFLAFLGLGAVSAPVAARSAVDAELEGLVLGARAPLAPPGVDVARIEPASYGDHVTRTASYLSLAGRPPAHVERKMREDAQYVGALDPDLAAKRSWSMSVKIAEQRQRNYERNLRRFQEMGRFELAQQQFERVSGFRWPW